MLNFIKVLVSLIKGIKKIKSFSLKVQLRILRLLIELLLRILIKSFVSSSAIVRLTNSSEFNDLLIRLFGNKNKLKFVLTTTLLEFDFKSFSVIFILIKIMIKEMYVCP